jgi:hypothetical protein
MDHTIAPNPVTHAEQETPEVPAPPDAGWSVRRAGVVAGVSLLLMPAAAVLANFVVVEGMIVPGDATATAAEIVAREGTFRLGVLAWWVIAVLDVVIAWALYLVFRPVSTAVSMLAAGFRLVYTAVLLVAVGQLLRALDVLSGDPYLGALSADQVGAHALLELSAFQWIYDTGLVLFGIHLALLGYLAIRSEVVPTVIGVLLVVAGAGYAVDSVGAVLALDLPFRVSMFTFLGELLLGLWLLFAGGRRRATGPARVAEVRRAL